MVMLNFMEKRDAELSVYISCKIFESEKQNNTIWSKWYPMPSAKFWLRPKKI